MAWGEPHQPLGRFLSTSEVPEGGLVDLFPTAPVSYRYLCVADTRPRTRWWTPWRWRRPRLRGLALTFEGHTVQVPRLEPGGAVVVSLDGP